ncbi:hypothetical protein CAP35_12530 [Chitinophagaceae bacterium IBVUCB1]|nr:hypothetical protein CAP35_12530 [Chitinophagaceae bacterium IBVUCB1]
MIPGENNPSVIFNIFTKRIAKSLGREDFDCVVLRKTFMKTDTLLFILAIIVLFIAALFSGKESKQSLAKFYNITRPTLLKWMKYFQQDIPIDDWQQKRNLTRFEVIGIKASFGSDTSLILSKKQIAELSDSDYKTVAENVKRNIDKLGITIEAWESCNIFPPSVSKKILEMLG